MGLNSIFKENAAPLTESGIMGRFASVCSGSINSPSPEVAPGWDNVPA